MCTTMPSISCIFQKSDLVNLCRNMDEVGGRRKIFQYLMNLLLFKIEVTVSLDVSLEISEILFLFSVFFTLECRKEFV